MKAEDVIDTLFAAAGPGLDAALRAMGEPHLGRIMFAVTPLVAQAYKGLFAKLTAEDLNVPLPQLEALFLGANDAIEVAAARRIAELRAANGRVPLVDTEPRDDLRRPTE